MATTIATRPIAPPKRVQAPAPTVASSTITPTDAKHGEPTLTFGKRGLHDRYAVECSCSKFQAVKARAVKQFSSKGLTYRPGDIYFECEHMDAYNMAYIGEKNRIERERFAALTPEQQSAEREASAKRLEEFAKEWD